MKNELYSKLLGHWQVLMEWHPKACDLPQVCSACLTRLTDERAKHSLETELDLLTED